MASNKQGGNVGGGTEGDTGYGCKAWAQQSQYTGGYNWPTETHSTTHAGGHVIYTRFRRVGGRLFQQYSGGGGTSRDAASKHGSFAMPPLDAKRCDGEVAEASDCWSDQELYMGTDIAAGPNDGVIIVMGEAGSCNALLDGGPMDWRRNDQCPFIIEYADYATATVGSTTSTPPGDSVAPTTAPSCQPLGPPVETTSCDFSGGQGEAPATRAIGSGVNRTPVTSCNSPTASTVEGNFPGGFCCLHYGPSAAHACNAASPPASCNTPDANGAITYAYDKAVTLQSINVLQHANGLNCIEAFLDGVSLGTSCPNGNRRGGAVSGLVEGYTERESTAFTGYDSTISGTVLRLQGTDTSCACGFAV
jgi:hypothetical protein